ncbi:MAG: hypothetical protein LBF79_00040, partial [Dysgonamonadaceae bacterium]|nr:hypothetical protein [Dysgonamonadaceae bacterium]
MHVRASGDNFFQKAFKSPDGAVRAYFGGDTLRLGGVPLRFGGVPLRSGGVPLHFGGNYYRQKIKNI